MFGLNNRNIKQLNKAHLTTHRHENGWLERKSVDNSLELSNQYASICQQHKQKRKWVLFVNPEENSLEKMASFTDIDTSKVLCVNIKQRNNKTSSTNIENIKNTLRKGTCSAVILSNAIFTEQEIDQLSSFALSGKTQCIILKNKLLSSNQVLH
ncbi:MAG: hypothetical protein OCD00_19025 [Colwellia sp.]